MKTSLNALLGVALLAGSSVAHSAIKPPAPDKALTPNSSNAPEGCKLLASDKQWPADDVWKSAFPGVYKKLKGTEAPDFMVQAKTVEDVQKAVNFAREHNVRLTIISTGHDFGGRETGRSGLRLDMAALREPTVFAQDWKCGDTLKPTTGAGAVAKNVQACKVKKTKRSFARSIPGRDHEYRFFEKRDGLTCEHLLNSNSTVHTKRHGPDESCDPKSPLVPCVAKRHGPEEDMPMSEAAPAVTPVPAVAAPAADVPPPPPAAPMAGMEGMEGMSMGPKAGEIPQYNVIKADPNKPAYARISAGVYNELFFNQAHASGLMTAGAQHGGVSVLGGWAQAGGHNPFVNRIGMQVDNIMELEVVTADGKFHKVSECNEPELFWALRGGGGSTFAVVTGGTVKVHPTFPVVVSRFFVNSTDTEAVMDASAYFLQQGAKLRDEYGLQGYFYIYPGGFQSVLHMPGKYATLENAKKVTEPLMAKMEELAKAKHIEPNYYEHKSYKAWYEAEMGDEEMEESGGKFLSWYDGSDGSVPAASDAMMNPLLMIPWAIKFPAGAAKRSLKSPQIENMEGMGAIMRSQAMSRTYLDSRLLSDKHVNGVSAKELSTALNSTFPRIDGNHVRGFLYGGGEQAKPAKEAMGLNPAWRDATYHFIINAVPGNIRHDYNIQPIAKLFPDAGGYVNEAAPGEENWKQVYWGEHYAKLEEIKKKVDPTNVFWCSPCVGADMLTYDDERLCKNPAYPQAGLAPQTYPNKNSTMGIAAMPGTPGIPNPLLPVVKGWMQNKTLPRVMPKSNYFKIAMGEGGSAGGKFANMDPYNPGQELKGASAPSTPQPSATGVGAEPNEAPGAAAAANQPAGGQPSVPKPADSMDGMAGMAGMAPAPVASPTAAPNSAPESSPAAAPPMDSMPGMDMGHGGMDMGGMDMGGAPAPVPSAESSATPAPNPIAESSATAAPTPEPTPEPAAASPEPAAPASPSPSPEAAEQVPPKPAAPPAPKPAAPRPPQAKGKGGRPKGKGKGRPPKGFPKLNGMGSLFGFRTEYSDEYEGEDVAVQA